MGFAGVDAGVLKIEGMCYYDPNIVTFHGTDPAALHSVGATRHPAECNAAGRS